MKFKDKEKQPPDNEELESGAAPENDSAAPAQTELLVRLQMEKDELAAKYGAAVRQLAVLSPMFEPNPMYAITDIKY